MKEKRPYAHGSWERACFPAGDSDDLTMQTSSTILSFTSLPSHILDIIFDIATTLIGPQNDSPEIPAGRHRPSTRLSSISNSRAVVPEVVAAFDEPDG